MGILSWLLPPNEDGILFNISIPVASLVISYLIYSFQTCKMCGETVHAKPAKPITRTFFTSKCVNCGSGIDRSDIGKI